MVVTDLLSAFRAGRELANAETWKKRQVLVNALVAVITFSVALAAFFGHPVNLDSQDVQAISAAVAALVGLFNGAATVATTTRIGMPSKADDPPDTKTSGDAAGEPDDDLLKPFDPDVFGTRDRA